MRTNIFVFVALREDQQQAFTHLHGAPALGTGEQCRLQSLERSPSLLWHYNYRSEFTPGHTAAGAFALAVRKNKSPPPIAQHIRTSPTSFSLLIALGLLCPASRLQEVTERGEGCEDFFGRLLGPASPSLGAYMDVAVVGNLPHYVIDDELALSVLVAPDETQRLYHKSAFLIGRRFAMFPQDRHRGIARVAIE
jgi:hypothetical protein